MTTATLTRPAKKASAQPGVKNKPYRANRKVADADIIRLNSLGLSLNTIAQTTGVHPTTVTLRLQGLGIEPADTRRSFMEDVLSSLNPKQLEWLSNQLGPRISIKDYIRNLIVKDFVAQTS